jgi:quercetin dioxygenase-like cupin family protein
MQLFQNAMAYKNKTICNPVTGQNITFLQTAKDTGGALLEMESVYNSTSKEPAPHYHPAQEEDFTVLEGSLSVKLNGTLRILQAGDTLHISKNEVHAMWNHTDGKTVVNWKVRPALDTEVLLETGTGLAADGKVNKKGMPPLLQSALIANHFAPVYRLAKPPFAIQKILFSLLAPIAYLNGYRPTYPKYLD